MTGRIIYTPHARQQLRNLDDRLAKSASPDVAQSYLARVFAHIEGILGFPHAGRPRDDLRQGIRTTTYKGRTLIAYDVDETSGEIVVNIIGIFHGGSDWEAEFTVTGEPKSP